MNSNALLDAVKARYGLPSDYALAKLMKCSAESVRMMRERGLSDDRALQCATLLDVNQGEAMASIRAERAKNPEVKAVWKNVAESMRSALGMVAAAALAALVFLGLPIPAQAAQETVSNTHYARCRRLRARLGAFLTRRRALPHGHSESAQRRHACCTGEQSLKPRENLYETYGFVASCNTGRACALH